MANRRRAGWWLLITVLTAFALSGCRGGTTWSKKEEVRIGQEIAAEVEKTYRLDPDPNVQRRVQLIGQRLMAVAGDKDFKYAFKVLSEKEINAFALPGGPIYVFRGLVDAVGEDDDMLACVLGHEMAHINRRHANKQYTKGLWASVLISLGTKGKVRDIAEITSALLELKYSRQDEYEADRLGIEYAYKAGYDPNGIVRFFELLKSKEKGGDEGVLANLRTHPLTENRIWRARQHIEQITGRPAQGGKP